MTEARDGRAAARRALACLDLTNLDEGCTEADIARLCARAGGPHGPVAAVCVWPGFVAQAAEALAGTGIAVATVVNFPAGGSDIEAAKRAADAAIADGATEIDMVVPHSRLAAGDEDAVEKAVAEVKAACGAHALKAILETGVLEAPGLIRLAAEHAIAGGADFLKTSTGKAGRGATPEAAEILLGAIRESGGAAGFKASGGVRTLDDAATYLDIADRIMGPGWAGPEHFRIGASGLLDAIEATLADDTVPAGGAA